MHQLSPIPFTDEHRQPCVRVPLTNAPGASAIVDEASYADLRARGLTGPWFLNDNGTGRKYVRTGVPVAGQPKGTLLLIARLILGAGPGTVVRYANGNPLDLRFTNLAWRKGKSKRTDAALLDYAKAFLSERNAPPAAAQSTPPNLSEPTSHAAH